MRTSDESGGKPSALQQAALFDVGKSDADLDESGGKPSALQETFLECAQLAAALGVMGKFFGVTGKSKACLLDRGEAASK